MNGLVKRLGSAFLCLCLGFGLLVLPGSAGEAQDGQRPVSLLVCDEQDGRYRLEALLRACGLPVVSVNRAEYSPGLLPGYERVITTDNRPYRDALEAGVPVFCVGQRSGPVQGASLATLERGALTLRLDGHSQQLFARDPVELLAQAPGEAVGSLTLTSGEQFPFAAVMGEVGYAPFYRGDDLSALALAAAVRRWMGGQGEGQMYVLIDEIYPFTDLAMLCLSAEQLHENGIPFILRIMPVYDNLDYPAFLRYAQVLRYAQSLGGTVVLHDPIVLYTDKDEPIDTRKERVRAALEGRFSLQRQPVIRQTGGEPIETKLARTKKALEDLGILRMDMALPPLELTCGQLGAIESDTRNFGTFAVDTMVTFAPFESEEELDEAIGILNGRWLSLSRYGGERFEEELRYDEIPVDEQFEYRKKEELSFTAFFAGANKLLILIVLISAGVFVLMLTFGRRIYRNKFYKE